MQRAKGSFGSSQPELHMDLVNEESEGSAPSNSLDDSHLELHMELSTEESYGSPSKDSSVSPLPELHLDIPNDKLVSTPKINDVAILCDWDRKIILSRKTGIIIFFQPGFASLMVANLTMSTEHFPGSIPIEDNSSKTLSNDNELLLKKENHVQVKKTIHRKHIHRNSKCKYHCHLFAEIISWPLEKITNVVPGQDGNIQLVSITKEGNHQQKRVIIYITPLPTNAEPTENNTTITKTMAITMSRSTKNYWYTENSNGIVERIQTTYFLPSQARMFNLIKHITYSYLSNIIISQQIIWFQQRSEIVEPIIKTSDKLESLRNQETSLQDELTETSFKQIRHHSITSSVITSLVIASIIITSIILYQQLTKYRNKRKRKPRHHRSLDQKQNEETVEMNPIYSDVSESGQKPGEEMIKMNPVYPDVSESGQNV